MKLYFPFPTEVRELYRYSYECFLCGQNGTQTGGLEIHHIVGRSKFGQNLDSAFNSSLLCNKCHSRIKHNVEEQNFLFNTTLDHLARQNYQPILYDYNFVRYNYTQLGLTEK